MNWAHVLLAGYIGAVIAIVVGMFRKKGWLGKISGAVVFVVAIVAWNLFDVHYLIPRESPDYGLTDAQKFENAMLAMPVYQVLKEQELVILCTSVNSINNLSNKVLHTINAKKCLP